MTASPDVAETNIALNAIADESAIRSKPIPGLGVKADTAAELGGSAAGELQPRRLFDQRYWIDANRCRCIDSNVYIWAMLGGFAKLCLGDDEAAVAWLNYVR